MTEHFCNILYTIFIHKYFDLTGERIYYYSYYIDRPVEL